MLIGSWPAAGPAKAKDEKQDYSYGCYHFLAPFLYFS
jgi:hypothetical protein